jgi:nicotinamide phosphoribosyltransferase
LIPQKWLKTMTHINLLIDTDSYKVSHWAAYPSDTTRLVAYMEPRLNDGEYMKFFGLQSLLMDWIANPITLEDVDEAAEMYCDHFMRNDVFPLEKWKYIATKYGGHLPIKISALPEGTLIKGSNLMLKVESTDECVAWVATFVETQLLRLWSDITVCTNSYRLRKLIGRYLAKTHDNPETVLPYMLHDFGSRGTSSRETAARMGLAHLVNFKGTDTVAALKLAKDYYGCKMAGYSIPAMEHSTVISWGRIGEENSYANFIDRFGKPGAIFAMVVDSYDEDNAVDHIIGKKLKAQILESNAKLMVRPDSGVPKVMVLKMLGYLDKIFGSTTNTKGYKVLNNVGVVQGDGVNKQSIVEILEAVIAAGYCVSNVVFGMGGALLQLVGRDDFRFAYKPCLVDHNHRPMGISKTPKGDSQKTSKGGDLDVILDDNGELVTIDRMFDSTNKPSQLVTYYNNGELLVRDTLDVIRARG